MGHGDFVRPGGQWPAELVPGAQDAQRLDEMQRRSINGDLGGTWNPKQPIVIGGAGLELGTSSYFFGGVTTKTGGRLVAPDPPKINDSRMVTLVVPTFALGVKPKLGNTTYRFDAYLTKNLTRGLWGLAIGGSAPSAIGLTVPRRYLHQGAQLVTVSLEYFIAQRPPSVPANPMVIFPRQHAYDGMQSYPTPNIGGTSGWASGVAQVFGNYIIPSSPSTNSGYYFKATTITGAGHTGASEPNWASVSTVGATINDYATPAVDGVVWTCTGRSGWLSTLGDTIDSYYANGAAQSLSYDADPASTAGMNTINNGASSATVELNHLDSLAILTGVKMVYSVSSMAFE